MTFLAHISSATQTSSLLNFPNESAENVLYYFEETSTFSLHKMCVSCVFFLAHSLSFPWYRIIIWYSMSLLSILSAVLSFCLEFILPVLLCLSTLLLYFKKFWNLEESNNQDLLPNSLICLRILIFSYF